MSLTPRSVALLIIQLHFLSAMPALIVGPFPIWGANQPQNAQVAGLHMGHSDDSLGDNGAVYPVQRLGGYWPFWTDPFVQCVRALGHLARCLAGARTAVCRSSIGYAINMVRGDGHCGASKFPTGAHGEPDGVWWAVRFRLGLDWLGGRGVVFHRQKPCIPLCAPVLNAAAWDCIK